MNLKKYIHAVYLFLKKHKSKWILCILLSVVFILIRFPYEEAVLYLTNQVRERTKSSIQFKYESFYINPIGPTLVFKNSEILTLATQGVFKVDELKLRASYASLLQLKPGGIITLKWSDSVLNLTIRKKRLKKNQIGWFVHLKGQNFNPAFLSAFAPVLSKTTGKINIDMKMLLDPGFEIQPVGSWSVTGWKIQSQALSYKFPGTIGTISLPSFKWGSISSYGTVKEGEVIISEFFLGEKKDAFQIKSRGVIFVDFTKKGLSKAVKPLLKNYNVGLEILASEDLKPKLYFLDLFFSSVGSQTPQGWRYLAQMKGNAVNFFDMAPVTQLPTLKEIQEPVNDPSF